MKKPPLRQGMVNGLVFEVVQTLEAVKAHAEIIADVTQSDRAKAYEAAFQIAIQGGGAEDHIRSRYEGLNCAEIAETLANQPTSSASNARPRSPTERA
jgi:hypothetical protein